MQGPLWDVAARGPAAYPNNAAFVHEYTTELLARSFPNMRPQQVQVRWRPCAASLAWRCCWLAWAVGACHATDPCAP